MTNDNRSGSPGLWPFPDWKQPTVDGVPVLLLDAKQAATALNIGKRKLWQLTNCGQIPHVRIDKLLRYPVDGLRGWIAERQQGGETAK